MEFVDQKLELVQDVESVLIVGSGGLTIGQAGEFDYSGSQAIKAIKESCIKTILINPNIATNQTSKGLADKVYFLPMTPEYITYVIERERPDAILLTFGGQTALNCGIELDKNGVLQKYDVKVLGTPIKTLETSEDRDLFASALKQIDIPIAESIACTTVEEAVQAAQKVGYPVIARSAYALGGLGSGFANNDKQLKDLAVQSLSLSSQILVEKSLKGWKEIEYEVVRDRVGNCITVCNMENFDPLGVHTGDSVVFAPSQTLSDKEFHMLRSAAIKIINHLGVVGECNVQYALQPDGLDYRVIEVNARLSRSSALASKATGYPLAYTAAKIALGYTLPQLPNPVTKTTVADFEPSLDYIVAKLPRWDLSKFHNADRSIGSSMKSVGEVMAIGRTFEEALQKAMRQLDPSVLGFQGSAEFGENLDKALSNPTDRRILAVGQALLHDNYSVDRVHELSHIDRWFLYKCKNIVEMYKILEKIPSLDALDKATLLAAKQLGFSDVQISKAINYNTTNTVTDLCIRSLRKSYNIIPFVKKIDTLAAEFPADTNYLYTTYNATKNDVTFTDNGILVLGSGVYRIGSSVEFDWCAVNTVKTLRDIGKKTIVINHNPETVSTDFDEVDKLYFEELSFERVMDIYELEHPEGCILSMGGQLPQNIALKLHEQGCEIMGTDPSDIDKAENRHKFSEILDSIGIGQPEWKELTSLADTKSFVATVGFPVLVRPSYVLSGAAMSVIYNEFELQEKLSLAAEVSPDHPVVISKFITDSQEIDIDAVAHKGRLLVHAVSEHVENAGIHSGDATLILPSQSLSKETLIALKTIASKIACAWKITGPFNLQIIRERNGMLKVIECNIRASRSFPFVSKVLGVNFIGIATKSILGGEFVPTAVDLVTGKNYDYVATKVPQFSFTRIAGADPFLGVEMASTGEVACFGHDLLESYWTAIQSIMNFQVPLPKSGILLGGDSAMIPVLRQICELLVSKDYQLMMTQSEIFQELKTTIPQIQLVDSPYHDRRQVKELFQTNSIQMVINISSKKATTNEDQNYAMRRSAVDFGIPLFNEPQTSLLFTKALCSKIDQKLDILNAKTVAIPNEVRSWDEYVQFYNI